MEIRKSNLTLGAIDTAPAHAMRKIPEMLQVLLADRVSERP